MSEPKQALGQLEGRARAGSRMFALGTAALRNEQRVERLVRGGGSVTLTIKPEKGGQVAREIALA